MVASDHHVFFSFLALVLKKALEDPSRRLASCPATALLDNPERHEAGRLAEILIAVRFVDDRERPPPSAPNPKFARLRGWACQIRTGESVRGLADWNYVTTSFEVGASPAAETLRVRAA